MLGLSRSLARLELPLRVSKCLKVWNSSRGIVYAQESAVQDLRAWSTTASKWLQSRPVRALHCSALHALQQEEEDKGPVRFVPKQRRTNAKPAEDLRPAVRQRERRAVPGEGWIPAVRQNEARNTGFGTGMDEEARDRGGEGAVAEPMSEAAYSERDLHASQSERPGPRTVKDRFARHKDKISFSRKDECHLLQGEEQTRGVDEGRSAEESPGGVAHIVEMSEWQREHEKLKRGMEVKDAAVKLLAKRALPKATLREKLLLKNIPEEDVDAALVDLERCGLVNDTEYAQHFARHLFKTLTWGPIRIRYALKQRGIEADIIEGALKKVFHEEEDSWAADTEEEEEEEEGEGVLVPQDMSSEVWRKLKADVKRQWLRGTPTNLEGRRRRLIGWLQRRGYSWQVINLLVREMERS